MRLAALLVGVVLAASAPAQVVLSTNPYAYGGANGKNVVRAADGTLWSVSVFDDGSATPGNRSILLLSSVDGGQTWTTDPFVFNDATSGLNPPNPTTSCVVAIDSTGTLHVSWARYYYPSYYRQYYRNYNPSTLTASAIVDLSAAFGLAVTARTDALTIAVDAADTVWIASGTASSWVSKLLQSAQPGAANLVFNNVGTISTNSSQAPEIAIDAQGLVHCSFYRALGAGNYEHRKYDPSTATWDATTTVLGNTTAPNDYYGKLAADSLGNVHALYVADAVSGAANVWKFRYKIWNAATGWSPELVLFDAPYATYNGIANYQIVSLGCDEASGKAYAFYRDLAAGGVLRLADKGLSDPAFTTIVDVQPATVGLHAYLIPSMRGSLYPSFNHTGTNLDLTWQARPAAPPNSWMFQRIAIAPPGPSLSLSAPASIGTSPNILISSPSDPFLAFVCVLSLGTTPGIGLPDSRVIPLNWDVLLDLCLQPANGIISNNIGLLDGAGSAVATLAIPAFAPLVGTTVFGGFIVVDPSNPIGIGTISQALPITFQ